jgi:hypothetical protein
MTLFDPLLVASNLGKSMFEKQKSALLDDAEAHLRTIAEESTMKIRKALYVAAGLITTGLLALALAVALS